MKSPPRSSLGFAAGMQTSGNDSGSKAKQSDDAETAAVGRPRHDATSVLHTDFGCSV